MSLALASRRAAISPAWVKNPLWRTARAVPSLDLPFADIKSLADAVTGQSLVTFTRASSGTSVGSDGVLRTAVTNLLLRSEEFDNASWAKLNNVTVTANATTAPNGFITADKIVEPASSADKLIVQPVTLIANTTYTASVYFKAADRPTILFHVRKSDYSTRFGGFFNTSTNVFAAETSGGGVLDSFTFTNVGGGWYRCSITGNIGANTAGIVTIYLANSSNNLTYTGDGTSGIYLWGAQLEQSSTVGEYIPTTSTINSAPRFDHAITSSVTNVIWPSEDFTTTWGVASATRFADAGIAPNGTLTADRIESTGGGVFRSGVSVLSGVSYTYSVYVKHVSGTGVINTIGFERFGAVPLAGQTSFNVLTGTVVSNGAAVTASSITPVGDGWYRVSVRATSTDITTTIVNYTSVSGNQFLLWGAQLEQSSTAGEYVRTTSAPATASKTESLGLLVEEQRTNSVTNNTMVGAVAGTPGTLPTGWGIFISPTGLTRTIVGSGTVNGINYIDVRFSGTPSSTGEITLYLSPVTTATLAQAWVSTVWLSLAGGSISNIAGINLRNFEINSGAYVREVNANFVSSISSDLVRRQLITTSFGASANQIQLVLTLFAAAAGTPIDITLRIGMPQLEQGAFATSVIPTTGTAATRSADVASITGTAFSSWYRQDEGTVFADAVPRTFANLAVLASFDDNSTANRVAVRLTTAANANLRCAVSSVAQADFVTANAATANTVAKIAAGYAISNFGVSLNGVTAIAQLTGSVPSVVNQLTIGSAVSGFAANSTIRRLTFWPARLPNSTLQAITQ